MNGRPVCGRKTRVCACVTLGVALRCAGVVRPTDAVNTAYHCTRVVSPGEHKACRSYCRCVAKLDIMLADHTA